jgi:hypothetical protein
MIYFTEIEKDKTGGGDVGEVILWQFYLKELPESITFPFQTKLAKIEYNGGFISNQIIGIYNREIEWSGSFFGTYTDQSGNRLSAKQRADELKEFMGRPIRVGFGIPTQGDEYVAGETPVKNWDIGKTSKGKEGIVGVYIIEEYDITIVNYSDVDYRIKLAPHTRQEKIKPTELEALPIKLNMEAAKAAGAKIPKAAKILKGKKPAARAVAASTTPAKLVNDPGKPKGGKNIFGESVAKTATPR